MVEIDNENAKKDIDLLDIEIPALTPRTYREYKNLVALNLAAFNHAKVKYQLFSKEEQREIVFKDISSGEVTHTTLLDITGIVDYRSIIAYFTKTIMGELRLFSGYDVLYGKVKDFVEHHLFENAVNLEDLNTIRNLSELVATKTIIETFKKEINALTVCDKGDAEIRDTIKLKKTRPFIVKNQESLIPQKSVFNRIVGDSHYELLFASFLEGCEDILSYAKNYFAVNFKLDYVNADGDISNYYPDFIIKLSDREIYIVETKGQVDLDVPLKMTRLKQWCEDVNKLQDGVAFDFVYVDEGGFEKYKPKNFKEVVDSFTDYK